MKTRAQRLAAVGHGDGFGALSLRIRRGVSPDRAIVVLGHERRHRKQLKIHVRRQARLVNDRRSLGLQADADPGSGESRCREAEERRVGGMAHAHDARGASGIGDPLDKGGQHPRKWNSACRPVDPGTEGRADPDYNLAPVLSLRRGAAAGQRIAPGLLAVRAELLMQHLVAGERIAHGRDFGATCRGGSVSGTGSEVAVRVIDRTEHPPVPDDGRGLQVITGDPMAQHGDQAFGLALESAAGQGADDIEHGRSSRLQRLVQPRDLAGGQARSFVGSAGKEHALLLRIARHRQV